MISWNNLILLAAPLVRCVELPHLELENLVLAVYAISPAVHADPFEVNLTNRGVYPAVFRVSY